MRTLEEEMAIAVLRGDRVAAYALADRLIEEMGEKRLTTAEQIERTTSCAKVDGYAVYHWPEFRAFAERLGLGYGMPTIDLTIHIKEGEAVRIDHAYIGMDTISQRPASVLSQEQ